MPIANVPKTDTATNAAMNRQSHTPPIIICFIFGASSFHVHLFNFNVYLYQYYVY